jgi:signal transduction histidine kinase
MSSDAALMFSAGGQAAREAAGGARHHPVLSTLPAGQGERNLALAVVLVSAALFAAVAPFAKIPLAHVPAFIATHQSALVTCDLITAVLLFSQFNFLRSRALLVLATGYLFTALITIAHALTYPDVYSPTGLLGAGTQTTAWLYFFWRGGFPLFVIVYALLKDEARPAIDTDTSGSTLLQGAVPVVLAVAVAFSLVCGLTLAATAGKDFLPVIMAGHLFSSRLTGIVAGFWSLSFLALAVLWRRRPHTVIDVWLMVVMCAWICDMGLGAVFNTGRYDLGFYAGRIYGLLAASFVLIVLLVENGRHYARLFEAQKSERRLTRDALARQAERLRLLHDIDRATVAEEAPQAIAEAVIRPLRELLGVPRAIVNMFDLEAGEVEWLAASGRHRTRSGPGVRYSIRLMGNVEALKRGEPQILHTRMLPPGPEVDALLASGVYVYMVMPMIAGGELIGALSFGGEQANFPAEQVNIARESATQLAVAIAQARLLERVRRQAVELEQRVRERTAELQAANRDLESFSYSVSHDLRAPLRAIDGFSLMLQEDYAAQLDEEGRRLLTVVRQETGRMGQLIDDLLAFSHIGRKSIAKNPFDMAALVQEVVGELSAHYPATRVDVGRLPPGNGDRALLKQVWINLIGNALKYSSRREAPRVQIGGQSESTENVYWVKDNGAGFDMRYREKLFRVFQRLHSEEEFSGTGVGLAIVQRVVERHHGRAWAEGEVDKGATFGFALARGESCHG